MVANRYKCRSRNRACPGPSRGTPDRVFVLLVGGMIVAEPACSSPATPLPGPPL